VALEGMWLAQELGSLVEREASWDEVARIIAKVNALAILAEVAVLHIQAHGARRHKKVMQEARDEIRVIEFAGCAPEIRDYLREVAMGALDGFYDGDRELEKPRDGEAG
jgi:hypothetical protein